MRVGTRNSREAANIAENGAYSARHLLTPGWRMGRMGDREPQPSGGLTVRVRIRGRDQRPEQQKHWQEEPQEALQPQEVGVGVETPATEAKDMLEASEDPVSVADEMYEDV